MTDQSASRPVTKSTRRRWLRWSLILLFVFVGLPAGYYFYARWSLERELAEVIAETDRLDPRWRFEDMEADRRSYPDEENSALQVSKVIRLIGRGGAGTPLSNKNYTKVFGDLSATAELNAQQVEMIRDAFEKCPEALIEARKLKDLPHGRYPMTWDPSGLLALLPYRQDVVYVCVLLHHDASLRTQYGDPDAAFESCWALLNASRSFGDDLWMFSFLERIQCDSLLVRTLERVLAQGHPKNAALIHMQQNLAAERDELRSHWISVVRGERAEFQRFFEPLAQGKRRWTEVADKFRLRLSLQDQLNDYLPALVKRAFSQGLRHRNDLVAAARLPLEEQLRRFTALEQKVDRSEQGKADLDLVLPMLPPDLVEFCASHLRIQARLAATEAGLACERFRITHERWPDSLDALVKANLLDAVPTDPFDGEPMRFTKRTDGIMIYSVGKDKEDNGGKLDPDGGGPPGTDIGFRLWDPAKRRQPPRPPVALKP